ncbi:MAG: deoxyhypusine synthase family protein [Candidatus Micrarchaeia archaeon]
METIHGFDLEEVNTFPGLLKAYRNIGIQASNLSVADTLLYSMVADKDMTFYISFTSTVISSGLREIMAQFIRDASPKVIITTAGAIEEDIMRTLGSFYLGHFNIDDASLRKRGINRIGNIFVPNERYEGLEKFVRPILGEFTGGFPISTRQLISRLSENINDPGSFLKAAHDIGCKVFCPAITDGALGIQLYIHKQKNREFCIDVTADMKELADITLQSKSTGALILGGGVPKHHTLGVNLLRGGLDKAVYISTAHEYDASLSGAYPREAVSWGKIKAQGKSVLVYADYSIVFPLLAKSLHDKIKENKRTE